MNARLMFLLLLFLGSLSYGETVEVSFNGAGSNTIMTNLVVAVGDTYGAGEPLVTPKKLGFKFLGWYDSEGSAISDNTIVSISSNHTLTAKWIWNRRPSPNYTLEKLQAIDMPLLEIETVDAEEPDYEINWGPKNQVGIANATKVPARLVMSQLGETLYDSGEYVKKSSGLTVKIRGNTSVSLMSQKPYKLKLQKEADLLLRGNDKTYADKDWVLLASAYTLNNDVGFKLGQLVGQSWTPSSRYVNVVMNGDYRGLYMLTEAVSRNKNGRINVDKNTGYIFERDAYWWNESANFKLKSDTTDLGFSFKYPDGEDISASQIAYISNVMESVWIEGRTGGYHEVLDAESFAGWLLAHDLMATTDAWGSNMFLTKFDNTSASRVQMSTVWDFDTSFNPNNIRSWSRVRDSIVSLQFPHLIASTNHLFNYEYRCKWEALRPRIVDEITHYLDEKYQGGYKEAVQEARRLSCLRWYRTVTTIDDDIAAMKSWFTNRVAWLDANIPVMDPGCLLSVDEELCQTVEDFVNKAKSNKRNTMLEGVVVTPSPGGGAMVMSGTSVSQIPNYYTVTPEGPYIRLLLNENAKPNIGGVVVGDGSVTLGVQTKAGLNYQLMTTPALGLSWVPVGEPLTGDGDAHDLKSPREPSATGGFYKVNVSD